MSNAALLVALVVALAMLGVVFNHLQARLGVLEVVLNDGLPPGYGASELLTSTNREFDRAQASTLLGPGLHLFVSRGCVACQRLLEELGERGLDVGGAVHLRFVDRPRPAAADVAAVVGAELHTHEVGLTEAIGIDPLPHAVALGPNGLIAHRTAPTVADVAETAKNAGIAAKAAGQR